LSPPPCRGQAWRCRCQSDLAIGCIHACRMGSVGWRQWSERYGWGGGCCACSGLGCRRSRISIENEPWSLVPGPSSLVPALSGPVRIFQLPILAAQQPNCAKSEKQQEVDRLRNLGGLRTCSDGPSWAEAALPDQASAEKISERLCSGPPIAAPPCALVISTIVSTASIALSVSGRDDAVERRR
jgi:hypothetical protein